MKKLLVFLFLFISIYVNAQVDCKQLPTKFKSYNEAESLIRKANFKLVDNVNTSSSSWIRGASYYSCDGRIGYLIIKTDKQDYIHKDLPIEVWRQFKSASSFGSFYNANIKNRYQLSIE